MHRILTALALVGPAGLALAHPGHSQAGASHWHAADAVGYATLALLVGAAWWLARRK